MRLTLVARSSWRVLHHAPTVCGTPRPLPRAATEPAWVSHQGGLSPVDQVTVSPIPSPVQPAIQETRPSLCVGRLRADVCLSSARLVAEVYSVSPVKSVLESRPTSAWTGQAFALPWSFFSEPERKTGKGCMILKVALTSGFFDFPKSSQLNETQDVSVRNLGGKEEDEGKPGNSRILDKRSHLVIGKGEGPREVVEERWLLF